MTARGTLLTILEENGGQMDLTELSKKMIGREALGFGVETLHVVHALRREGTVTYNRETEVVALADRPSAKV